MKYYKVIYLMVNLPPDFIKTDGKKITGIVDKSLREFTN